MSDAASTLLLLVAIPSMLVALIAWPCIIFFSIQAARNAKTGVNVWGRKTRWNPFNVLLFPNLLTEQGLQYRRRCFQAIACFVVPILATMLLAALTGNLN